MGCDLIGTVRFASDAVSIHAPAWGATFKVLFYHLDFIVSIHAPAWGATDADS